VGGEAAAIIVPLGADISRGWGARLSVAQDYLYDQPVQLGNLRYGPDLANFGHRLGRTDDLHQHLYDSALVVKDSPMPPYRFLYAKQTLPKGAAVPDGAVLLTPPSTNSIAAGEMIFPTEKALALAAYLASLKSDAMLFEAPRPKPAPPASAATNNAAAPAK
jgi:cytochrome c oxidase cbb3-type subunit 2